MIRNEMGSFLSRLSSEILVSDGAMGTQLQARGMPVGVCPEEFNISHPEMVRSIHKDYFDAGSDLVETNTFGANRFRLRLHGFEGKVREFCMQAVALARDVAPSNRYVSGSVGPTGEILAPLGTAAEAEIFEAFVEQVESLAEGGADIIQVETMMAIEEAELAVRAAKERTGLPVIATMTFEFGKAGYRTMWGVTIAQAVERLTAAGADVVGANCGKGFDEMIGIAKEMRPLTSKPVIAQSNAGIPDWIDGVSVYRETPEIIVPKASELLKAGVNIIGGCCGTGPEHVKAIRKLVS